MQTSCQIAVFVLVALVAATPNCPASTVGLEALYTTTISSTVTITGVPEAQKSITSANYMTVLVTIQLGNDVSLSFWFKCWWPVSGRRNGVIVTVAVGSCHS